MSAPAIATVLAWDSEHWDTVIARVHDGSFTAALAPELEAWAEGNDVQLLSYLCDARDGESLVQAQLAGFSVVDVRIELEVDLASCTASSTVGDQVTLRAATAADVPRLRALAAAVHRGTRFSVDPRLRARAGSLYERWIERDVLAGPLAQTAVIDGQVVGYLTGSRDSGSGSISLLGVDEAARGRGVGRSLVRSGLEWFRGEDCRRATVVTSASALVAQRLYHDMGFRPAKVGLWLHRWRVDGQPHR